MVDPEDVHAFIEHCKAVYGRTLSESDATRCLNNLLDFYDLVLKPLPAEHPAPPGASDPSQAAPGIS